MRITTTLKALAIATLAWAGASGTASAQVSRAEMIAAGMPADLADFAAAVSASEGTWTSVNQFGCAGAFQFCPATRQRYFAGSRDEFLASPAAQVSAYRRYMADEWRLAARNGFDSLIGRQVCWNGQCATITASSILKACQFGCASRGALGRYFTSGDCAQARDGNGVSVCTYLIRGSGYDVSSITGTSEPGAVPPGGAGTCFDRDLLSMAGVRVTSPFGADRTGRASAGYHLGLDIANNAGRGDLVFAGVPGRVVRSHADRTNSVFIETPDGRQRVGYLHGAARRVALGDEILPDTTVITMGDTGSPGAVHLHLEVHVSGEVMASLGEAAGRVWPLQSRESFFGSKQSSGLSGASLEGAAPAAFYVVNPETYLHSRLPFTSSVLNAEQYARQGFSRPDGLTLEPTCAPSGDFLDGGGLMSSNGGASPMGGVFAFGTALAGNPQTLANLASSDGRDAAIQYGQAAIGATQAGSLYNEAMRVQVSVLAGLILATERP
jgi:murein DD-endopeptidase MepM/ murein hydrolase activator NlpD